VQPILGYLYKQSITVVKNADFTPYRENQLVYAKPLQIYKGVDNQFQLLIKNADQKPVSLLDSTIVFNLIDPSNQELVFSRNLQIVYTAKGTVTTVLESRLLDDILAGQYNYSVIITNGEGQQQIAYADDNYNAQGTCYISDKAYPQFTPSYNPNLGPFYNNASNAIYGYSDANQVLTPVITVNNRTKSRAVTETVQYYGNAFVGTIETQGSLDPIPTSLPNAWFSINSVSVNNLTGTNYFNLNPGKYSQVRFHVTTTSGSLTKILYRP
jgi:hypothetical protein